MSDLYNATLIARIEITPRLAIFRVRVDDRVFDFTPGQYTVLGLTGEAPKLPEAGGSDALAADPKKLIKRAYSISSGSRERDFLEFYVSLVTSGELTPRLFALPEGGRLFVGGKPKGLFTLAGVPAEKAVLLVATGTGLAPYVSMLRTHLLDAPDRRLAVLHGASYSWDLGYRGELESLSRIRPHCRYLPIVSRPADDPDWGGRTGRLTTWLARADLAEACGFPIDPGQAHVFLCGNPGMVEEAARLLEARGYAQGARANAGPLHLEKYW
ncbi:MAG: ferredoxin--NADP reductase [Rhodospirillales bacterium]|nr:ferredoxin--NADP reductase [Rhodospirillales bacterium]